MEDMIQYIRNDRFAQHVGIKLVKVEPGYAVTELEIGNQHMNGVNIVQGGVIFTLADYAFAAACNSKGLTLGINANITYYKSPEGRILTAEAKEITTRKKICGYNVDVFDENKELVARFNGMGYVKSK